MNVNNKYRISRRGKKLLVNDDVRTLAALPREVPERTWAEILQKEENDLVVLDLREEILEAALTIGYERYMERQNVLFTTHCAAQAWLRLIDWQFYRHDPGEEPSSAPACFIPKRAESWQEDEMPEPSPKDSWGQQNLEVLEEAPEEKLVKWPSHSSLDMQVVEDIPKEYWFPGKVNIYVEWSKDNIDRTSTYSEVRTGQWIQSVTEAGSSHEVSVQSGSTDDYAADSELLQKVTEYSSTDLSPKESQFSALKTTTPVDGSIQGAGDSTLVRHARKTDYRKGASRISMTNRSRFGLHRTDSSKSHLSVISDCRMRNLRLDTQYEISSEKETPKADSVKKK